MPLSLLFYKLSELCKYYNKLLKYHHHIILWFLYSEQNDWLYYDAIFKIFLCLKTLFRAEK